MYNIIKENIKVVIGVLILLVIMFFIGKCSKGSETITKTIRLPAIKGKSDTIYKPVNNTKIIQKSYIYRDSVMFHDKEFDKEMADKFLKLNSDYEKIKEYVKSVEINTYQIPLEDSLIKTTSNLKVRGELISYQRDYTIKERRVDVEVKVPKTIFKMNAGVGLRTTVDLNKLVPTANVILTNYKGNHLIFEAGLDQSIQVGVSLKIFEIKR